VNDIVDVVSTGEILLVTAINTGTNTLTVTRSWGATAAAAMADNAYLLIIGNSYSEISTYSLNPQKLLAFKDNQIQDTRHSFGTSYILQKSELYNGDQRAYFRKKFLVDHMKLIESSLIFGEKQDGTAADGAPRRTTGGVLEFQSSNALAVGGALTKQTFNGWLKDVFKNTTGSTERILLCSPLVANAISNFAADNTGTPRSQMWVMNNAREFGLNVMSYITKFGTIHLVIHGLLDGSVYEGYAIALDPSQLRLVKLANGYFMNMREDIVQDGAHRWVDEFCTYFGLEYRNPETGGIMTGITG